jgi:hypothetical protein
MRIPWRWLGVLGLWAAACGGKAVIDGYPPDAAASPDGGPGGGGSTTTTTGTGGHAAQGGTGGTGGSTVGGCGGGVLWAWTAGDVGDDDAAEVGVDSTGAIVVVGSFSGTMAMPGATLSSAGGLDAFVVKLDPAGNVVWARSFGDAADQSALGVAIDANDDIVMIGWASGSVDFGAGPVTAAAEDVMLVRLDSAGSTLWGRLLGGTHDDRGEDVAIDPSGRILLAGSEQGAANFGGGALPWTGGNDAFVACLDANGGHQWSRGYGDADDQTAMSIAVDSTGSALVAGSFRGQVGLGCGTLTAEGTLAGLVAKLLPDGSCAWSAAITNAGRAEAKALAVDGTDAILITGNFEDTITLGGAAVTSSGQPDIFLAKLTPDGSALWAEAFGDPNGIDNTRHVDVTRQDEPVLTAPAAGQADFGCGPLDVDQGDPEAVVTKLDPNGALLYSTVWGDAPGGPSYSHQYAEAAADDGAGGLAVVGVFDGSIQIGNVAANAAGSRDWFVARLGGLP